MSNPNSKLYVSDITEAEPISPRYGDVEVLLATDKEKQENYEKSGNQSADYYNDECVHDKIKEEKVGNQSTDYYSK